MQQLSQYSILQSITPHRLLASHKNEPAHVQIQLCRKAHISKEKLAFFSSGYKYFVNNRVINIDQTGVEEVYVVTPHQQENGFVKLAEWIQQRKVTKAMAFEVFGKLIEIIAVLHAEGIVHWDISPLTIWINDNKQVKISPFVLDHVAHQSYLRTCQDRAMTFGNLSPQQFFRLVFSHKIIEPSIEDDQWAIGYVLHLMLEGNDPLKVDMNWMERGLKYLQLCRGDLSLNACLQQLPIPKALQDELKMLLELKDYNGAAKIEKMHPVVKRCLSLKSRMCMDEMMIASQRCMLEETVHKASPLKPVQLFQGYDDFRDDPKLLQDKSQLHHLDESIDYSKSAQFHLRQLTEKHPHTVSLQFILKSLTGYSEQVTITVQGQTKRFLLQKQDVLGRTKCQSSQNYLICKVPVASNGIVQIGVDGHYSQIDCSLIMMPNVWSKSMLAWINPLPTSRKGIKFEISQVKPQSCSKENEDERMMAELKAGAKMRNEDELKSVWSSMIAGRNKTSFHQTSKDWRATIKATDSQMSDLLSQLKQKHH